MKNFFTKYIIPGLIFQSIVVGGGYGTGREIVEFFSTKGPIGGYLGIFVSMIIWSLIMTLGFELARKYELYDYRTFLQSVLGRFWWLFEIIYIAIMILTVAVVGSASGELLHEVISLPRLAGIVIMVVMVGFLVFRGSVLIEKVMSFWSICLYMTYFVLIIFALSKFGHEINEQINSGIADKPWLRGGFQYAAYNLAALPAILFVTRHFTKRKEAIIAGMLAGPLAMIPAILLYTAMLSQYPEILSDALPAYYLIKQFNAPIFQFIFQIILFGTFIETGTGMIHGFNERIAGVYREKKKKMPHTVRLWIGLIVLLLAIFLADTVGLIQLIAKGYGYITWAFWIIFLIPLLIVGSRKVFKLKIKN